MSQEALEILCKTFSLAQPKNISIVGPFWYVAQGAKAGNEAIMQKYGKPVGLLADPKYRKQKWFEWWRAKGQFTSKHIGLKKTIRRPRKSKELAEFVGAMLGDGGITAHQVTITLHSEDDKEYGQFICQLMTRLFNVSPKVYPSKVFKANDYTISRSLLVNFCTEIGLKIGNKIEQKIDIPDWVKAKRGFQIACVRGLVDTDGSVYKHSYIVGNKRYTYKKLAFTSLSQPLRESVVTILLELGLKPHITRGKDVRLEDKQDVASYFELVGSHNPKHLSRFYEGI